MTIIPIPDIHGLTKWKNIVEEFSTVDKFVFLGDYLDPYQSISEEDLINNLLQIINFKITHPHQVELLLGNHDTHYFSEESNRSSRYNSKIATVAKETFEKYKSLFKYIYQQNNYIFSHAGIDESWVKSLDNYISKDIIRSINEGIINDYDLNHVGIYRGGFNTGGPLWLDIREFKNPLKNFNQVVGHTKVDFPIYKDYGNEKVIFCDCLQEESIKSLILWI